MAIDMEKAGVTELSVRMHCNSCAHKIRKAIRTIDGVYDINIDIHQQKITVVGGADPELLVKAIKKKKKTATVSSHTEPAASQPPTESPPAEATPPPAEPPKDVPPTEPPKEPPPPPPPPPAETPEPAKPPLEEVNMMHHHYHPHSYAYGSGHWNSFGHDTWNLAPYHAMHSYNTHRPSPYVTENVSDYAPVSTMPRDARYDHGYGDGYYQNRGGDSNQMASMFSEENPNSCTIV